MAKTAEKTELSLQATVLEPYLAKLKQLQFDRVELLEIGDEGQAGTIVWGNYKGNLTPRIFVWVLAAGQWEKAKEVQSVSWNVMPADTAEDQYPQFGVVIDGEHTAFFDISYPAHEIDRLPTIEEISDYKRIKADPTYKWSLKMYNRLMNGFDAFHEQVYQNVKDRVSSKNDIILEVAKILFLESFRLKKSNSPSDLEFPYKDKKLRLDKVFTVEYVQKHEDEAIKQIQAAFDHFKAHPDYVVTTDADDAHPIFDEQTHLLLARPQNYQMLLDLIQNLGQVTLNNGSIKDEQGTLADIAGDVLGRVFDVFLRGKFESKGGLGIYLTPAPVKQAMLAIAFHDLVKETPELLVARDEQGLPLFRFCDPTCGSYGFGVVAMGHLERALMDILGKETAPDARRDPLFKKMCEHSFVGADAAPTMITLARVNMAMLGAPQAKIFYTDDSLVSPQLKPCSFDLICTNPPFGTPKFSASQGKAKKSYEEAKEQILADFRSDLHEREGKKGVYDYEPTVAGRAMGAKPDAKGVWKPVKPTSIDPAVLFIDRCLQLLKPGGRLLMVVPDGVLCNSGDRYVREYIMGKKDELTGQFHGGKAIVKAVISLPSDTFKLSGTGAKTSILYLQKRRAREDDLGRFRDEPQGAVFMAVADTLGYVVKNNVEDYSMGVPNDLAAIVGAYVRGE
jgi:type I restriction enzyme M protein